MSEAPENIAIDPNLIGENASVTLHAQIKSLLIDTAFSGD